MATLEQLEAAERRMIELLEDAGLPLPDEVEFGDDLIRLLWYEQKVALEVVEID